MPSARRIAKKIDSKIDGDAKKFTNLLRKYVKDGMPPDKAVRLAWAESGYGKNITSATVDGILLANGLGASVKVTIGQAKVRNLLETYQSNGNKLSESVYKNLESTRSEIVAEVKKVVSRGTAVSAAAQELHDMKVNVEELPQYLDDLTKQARSISVDTKQFKESLKDVRIQIERLNKQGNTERLKVAYRKLANAIESGTQEMVDKAIERASFEKARYNARRLMQTETAKAFSDGFHYRIQQDDDIIGYRSVLSTSHRVYDICDFYADADLHGLGAGGYPKENGPPYPYHPHCQCSLEPIYEGEFGDAKSKPDVNGGKEYLNSVSKDERIALMGVSGEKNYRANKDGWSDYVKQYEEEESKIGKKIV